jgi:hypothetical protein
MTEYQLGPFAGTVGREKPAGCKSANDLGHMLAWLLTLESCSKTTSLTAYGAPACKKQLVRAMESCND